MASEQVNTPHRLSAATKLRRMLENTDEIIAAPGVYDGFSARIALQVGFDCLYMVRRLHPPCSPHHFPR
jgi:methylisocitrate lyase